MSTENRNCHCYIYQDTQYWYLGRDIIEIP